MHAATVNQQITTRRNGAHLPPTWSYAHQNPAEVVAEGFTAMTRGRDVPKAIAAIYVAYGGIRSNEFNTKLIRAFGGPVRALGQPEAALPHI